MNQAEFEAELNHQGYLEVVDRRMHGNELNPDHAHEFDARVLVIEGEMTIASDAAERTYRAGEAFAIAAGRRHAERSGPQGARYLAGRRHQPKAGA